MTAIPNVQHLMLDGERLIIDGHVWPADVLRNGISITRRGERGPHEVTVTFVVDDVEVHAQEILAQHPGARIALPYTPPEH